jgi:hypothetical protein
MSENHMIVHSESVAIEAVKVLQNIVLQLRKDVLQSGVDYGVIPGTGDKPTLLLPGMEKLLRALRLRPEYHLLSSKEDFDKPLFYYRYECRLVEIESGLCVSTAIGSANSYEGKWRWRKAERKCPTCGKEAIIKGRAEYGGGWLCFNKKGGCGAKFAENAPEIVNQEVGRIENTDIFDQINTIDKIAQKRALGSAIKGAANVSEYFTVDLDDLQRFDVVDAEYPVIEPPAIPPTVEPTPPPETDDDAAFQTLGFPLNFVVSQLTVRLTSDKHPLIVANGDGIQASTFTRAPLRPVLPQDIIDALAQPGVYTVPALRVFYRKDGSFNHIERAELAATG